MKILKRLIGAAIILLVVILSFNYFTNPANAKEDTPFYKDQDGTNYENLDVLLYTDGKLIYQIFGEGDTVFGSLYKLNIIDGNGEKNGTYSFPENHLFDTRFLKTDPIIDKNGNLLISYIKFESTFDDSSFYLASISPTGNLNWEFEVGYYGANSPTFGSDGTIYFVASENRHFDYGNTAYAYALTEDGEELWKQKIAGEGHRATPLINEDSNLVFSTWLPGYQSLHYTLSADGQILDLELTDSITSSFYSNGNKYYTEKRINPIGDLELTLKATDHNNKKLWNYSFGIDNQELPEIIDHVTNDGIVYFSSDGHFVPVASISNGSLNWTTNGIPLYYDNDVYTLNSLKGGSTSISKLDTKSGKAIDTEILNLKPSDAVAFDKDVILLAVDKNIYKVSFDNNKKTGWVNKSGKWLYYNQNGILKTGWLLENGQWYYLDFAGVMKSGWYQEDEKWHYSTSDGWYQENEKWYYSTSNGKMQTGWIKDKNKWYFLSSSGAMESGWIKDKGTWYYTSSDGAMQTGWINDKNKWYFLNSNGAMQIGWKLVNSKWYYFYSSGQMAANTTVDGYKLDKDGAWIQ